MRMQTVERLSITLPAEMARMIRAQVEAGRYASNSELIREALRAWAEREERQQQRLAVVRAKIRESLDDPRPSIGHDEVFRGLRERHAARQRNRKADAES
jgi:antitoxin ParD1/3/4